MDYSKVVGFILRKMLSVRYPSRDHAERNEIEELENEVRYLMTAFHDMDRNSAETDLKRQIKELVNDSKDIWESWLIHSAAANTIFGRRAIGYRLERERTSIKQRLEPIRRMIRAYANLQLQHEQPTEQNLVPSVQLSRTIPPTRIKKIVGFEDEAQSLIDCLLQEIEGVISITGMPGIGKTTLAWKIFQNETIRSEFPTRIWVDFPHHFYTQLDLYRSILKEFFKQGVLVHEELVTCLGMPQESCSKVSHLEFIERDRISSDQIIYTVHHCLKKSRFLLVLDNVWTADALGEMRHFLPKMGKFLITSRNNHVPGKPHVLRFLNEEESWDLLELEVFGMLGECPQTLKSTGENIAKNCDGSPLAIISVGASLGVTSSTTADNYLNEKWWKQVSQNVMLYVTDYDRQYVFKSIELSYTKLTQCLRDCFLYLGVFPQGHEIPIGTLIRLWIAERLVEEEAAVQALRDLISKNMVMIGKIYPNGQIKTCRLHNLMYGFCKDKAAEQDFYHEIKMSGGRALDSLISLAPNHRRLCINSDLSGFLSSKPKGRCVRSILCLNKNPKLVLHPKECTAIHECFESLRVLECKYVNFTKFPYELTKMILLRYISLSCDDLDALPETITSLVYLETLIVYTHSDSFKLEANIWRMFQLRHLVTKAAIVLSIRGNGKAGENLQTLTRLAPACCTGDVLARTPNLKTLGVRGKLSDLSEAESVGRLEFLENLKLINEPAADIDQWQPNCFPPNLKRLTLSGTYLGWEFMSVLGQIDSLEILRLKNNAFVGGSWTSRDADGFRRLEFLMIATTDLVYWDALDDSFPSLKCLVLKNCEKLEKIPSTLARSLDTLEVENVSESVMDSARETEHRNPRRQGQSRW